jgi:hypothetical protein
MVWEIILSDEHKVFFCLLRLRIRGLFCSKRIWISISLYLYYKIL